MLEEKDDALKRRTWYRDCEEQEKGGECRCPERTAPQTTNEAADPCDNGGTHHEGEIIILAKGCSLIPDGYGQYTADGEQRDSPTQTGLCVGEHVLSFLVE